MGRRDFNKQGFDLREVQAMRAQQQAEIMSLRINLASGYFRELVKPNAERTRDKIAAAKEGDEKVDVDFSLEAMLARELADTFLVTMGLIKPHMPPAEQSEANGEAKPASAIIVP